MLPLLLSLVLTSPDLPPACQAPQTRDVAALSSFAHDSGSLSVGLDSVATWCFDSSGAWSGGQPLAAGKSPNPNAAPTGDCKKAIESCKAAATGLSTDQRTLLFAALGDLERPFLGMKYTPRRSGLAERPNEIATCDARDRSTLFAQAQARMDLARLASQTQSEYANYKTWLYAEGLKCGQAVARGEKDLLQKKVTVDAPTNSGGAMQVPGQQVAVTNAQQGVLGGGNSQVTGVNTNGQSGGVAGASTTLVGGVAQRQAGTTPVVATGSGQAGLNGGGAVTNGAGPQSGASGSGSQGGARGSGSQVAVNGSGSQTGASGSGSQGGVNGAGAQGGVNGAGAQTGASGSGSQVAVNGAGAQPGANGSGSQGGVNGSASQVAVNGAGAQTGGSGSGSQVAVNGAGAQAGVNGSAAQGGANDSGAQLGSQVNSGAGTGAPSGLSGSATQTGSNGSAAQLGASGTGAVQPVVGIPLGGPTAERQRALASSMLEKWRYFLAEQSKIEQDADWVSGFLASRELRTCACQRQVPGEVVRRLENKDRVAQLEADDDKNTRCELCLLDAYPPWKTRAVKQCALAMELSDFELGVLERSDDGNGLPPRCMEAARAKLAGKTPPSIAQGTRAQGNTYIITRTPEPQAPPQPEYTRPTEYAPAPLREDGRIYVRVFTSAACVAELLPGPIEARTGDLLPIPPQANEITVRGPCGGFAEVYFGKEEKPRVAETFARNQPLRLQFRAP